MPNEPLLEAFLDSWARNNRILINLLRAVSDTDMELTVLPGTMCIARMFSHMHFCRLYFVNVNAPEFAQPLPEGEAWPVEHDRARLEQMLNESAKVMRDAVRARVESGIPMVRDYEHPILLIQHFVWHEGYHHAQIKLAMKAAGRPFDDEEIGRVTWDIWMNKTPKP